MAQLHLPVDFERLPEFRQLCEVLARVQTSNAQHPTPNIQASASFLFMRLWVELAYQAQITNQPGLLTPDGASLFAGSVGDLFGDDCDPVKLLVEAGVLVEQASGLSDSRVSRESGGDQPNGDNSTDSRETRESTGETPVPPSEYQCARFARLNAHLAGNFVSKEIKGANHSALVRSEQRIAHEALSQVMLLPPEMYRKRDGTTMSDREINRAMVLIITVDNCLKLRSRRKEQFTEGLICDASAVAEAHSAEFLKGVYQWIKNQREHPALPKTTEQILAGFEGIVAMAGSEQV